MPVKMSCRADRVSTGKAEKPQANRSPGYSDKTPLGALRGPAEQSQPARTMCRLPASEACSTVTKKSPDVARHVQPEARRQGV